MKRHLSFTIAALAVAVSILASCSAVVTPDINDESSAATGAITVRVQPVSASVQRVFTAMYRGSVQSSDSKSVSSRVFLGAGLVKFKVIDQYGYQADSWSVWPNQYQTNAAYPMNFEDSRILPEGPYTLYADVYNSSGDASPSVSGWAPLYITGGQSATENYVSVPCLPYAPTDVYENTPSSEVTLDLPWYLSQEGIITTIGSEKWFRAFPSSALTDFTATPTASASVVLMAFDKTGAFIGSAGNQGPGTATTISAMPTVPGEVYYIAAIDVNTDTSDGLFNLATAPYVVPPTQIPWFGSYFQGSIASNEVVWYEFNAIGGHTYAVNWDDIFYGSGYSSADLWVDAYQYNTDTPYILADHDSGWMGSYYYQYGTYYPYSIDLTQTITLPTSGKVYLRVREYSPGGSYYGSFALMITDTTPTNFAPSALNGFIPNYNATGIGAFPTLSWNPSSDEDGDPVLYTLYFSQDGGNYYQTLLQNSSEISYPLTWSLSPGTTYYWYVEASDGRGGIATSEVQVFTTSNTAPVDIGIN